MSWRICPKCGVIFTNGQRECEDCGVILKNATEEEKARFETATGKKLRKASALSSSSVPTKEHIITAIVIPLFSLTMYILFGGAFFGITFWNLFVSAISFIPRFRIYVGKAFRMEGSELKLKREVKIERFYYPVLIRIALIANGIFNILLIAANVDKLFLK